MAWQPAEIKTKLLDMNTPEDMPVGGNCISVDTAVKDMFKQLGKEDCTHGNIRHGTTMSIMSCVPSSLVLPFIYTECLKGAEALEAKNKKAN